MSKRMLERQATSIHHPYFKNGTTNLEECDGFFIPQCKLFALKGDLIVTIRRLHTTKGLVIIKPYNHIPKQFAHTSVSFVCEFLALLDSVPVKNSFEAGLEMFRPKSSSFRFQRVILEEPLVFHVYMPIDFGRINNHTLAILFFTTIYRM